MKKVLIALDYCTTAQTVVDMGFSFSKAMGAEVTLLHVIEDSTYYSILEYPPIKDLMGFKDTEVAQLLEREPKKAMELFLEKTKQYLGDASIKTILKEGDFAESIIDCAKELHADIIVIGSHGRNWLKNIAIGSVTEKVLHLTSIPLFIIPTNF